MNLSSLLRQTKKLKNSKWRHCSNANHQMNKLLHNICCRFFCVSFFIFQKKEMIQKLQQKKNLLLPKDKKLVEKLVSYFMHKSLICGQNINLSFLFLSFLYLSSFINIWTYFHHPAYQCFFFFFFGSRQDRNAM